MVHSIKTSEKSIPVAVVIIALVAIILFVELSLRNKRQEIQNTEILEQESAALSEGSSK